MSFGALQVPADASPDFRAGAVVGYTMGTVDGGRAAVWRGMLYGAAAGLGVGLLLGLVVAPAIPRR